MNRSHDAARAALIAVVGLSLVIWAVIAAGPYLTVSLKDVVLLVPLLALVIVGALITVQRPQAPLGWLLLAVGALTAAGAGASAIGSLAIGTGVRGWWVTLAAAVGAVTWPLTFGVLTSFLILLFPDGLPSRRWLPVAWLAGTACAGTAIASLSELAFPLVDSDGPAVRNPLGWLSASQVDAVLGGCLLICLGIGLISLVALFIRVRRADQVLRLQLRWVSAALLLMVVTLVIPGWLPGMSDSFNPYAVAALTLLVISLGFAITRYHLYDIDRVISRTASYGLVTAFLVLIYASIVLAAGRLLGTKSPIVIALATLAAAAIARPALRRVQAVVDRRFNRARYDGQRVVEQFGHRLSADLQPERVVDEMVDAVERAIEPSSVAVWVRP